MTVYEYFKSKSIDELAEWLDEHVIDDSPWISWWDNKYCKKCDSIYCEDGDCGNGEYGWCELNGKCKFFQDMDNIPDNKQIIKMWLEREI